LKRKRGGLVRAAHPADRGRASRETPFASEMSEKRLERTELGGERTGNIARCKPKACCKNVFPRLSSEAPNPPPTGNRATRDLGEPKEKGHKE